MTSYFLLEDFKLNNANVGTYRSDSEKRLAKYIIEKRSMRSLEFFKVVSVGDLQKSAEVSVEHIRLEIVLEVVYYKHQLIV